MTDWIFQFRRGTAARWTLVDPILHAGEPGFETDTDKMKLGDGISHWSTLGYIGVSAEDLDAIWAAINALPTESEVTIVADDLTALTTVVGGKAAQSALDAVAAALATASSALTTETTDRAAADTALGARIDTEITDRAAGDTANADALTAETTARTNADTAITTALTTKADLVGGVVPSSQLPSYVDDVLEFANLAAFPVTGEAGKIYVALDTNLTYRWGGSAYGALDPSLALGETAGTAYRGDRGKIAYDHSQITDGNPHGTTAAQVPNTPAGGVAATTVQAAINELDTEKATVVALNSEATARSTADIANADNLTAHLNDASAAHAASAVSFTPSGLIIATDVQAALQELDAEKATITALNTETTDRIANDNAIAASIITAVEDAADVQMAGLELGFAELASNFTTTSVALGAFVTGLTVTVVGQGRPVDITFYCSAARHSVAGTAVTAYLDVNGSATAVQSQASTTSSPITTSGRTLFLRRRTVLTNGVSYTFKVGVFGGAAGTCTLNGSAGAAIELAVTSR